jgi:hypothetical protein
MENYFLILMIIVLSSISILFTMGNFVFTIGEFKEITYKVPKIFISILIQIFCLLIFQIIQFNHIFKNQYLIKIIPISITIILISYLINIMLWKFEKSLKTNSEKISCFKFKHILVIEIILTFGLIIFNLPIWQ